ALEPRQYRGGQAERFCRREWARLRSRRARRDFRADARRGLRDYQAEKGDLLRDRAGIADDRRGGAARPTYSTDGVQPNGWAVRRRWYRDQHAHDCWTQWH